MIRSEVSGVRSRWHYPTQSRNENVVFFFWFLISRFICNILKMYAQIYTPETSRFRLGWVGSFCTLKKTPYFWPQIRVTLRFFSAKLAWRRLQTVFKAPKHHFAMRNVKMYTQIAKAWVLEIILVGKSWILAQFGYCTKALYAQWFRLQHLYGIGCL